MIQQLYGLNFWLTKTMDYGTVAVDLKTAGSVVWRQHIQYLCWHFDTDQD